MASTLPIIAGLASALLLLVFPVAPLFGMLAVHLAPLPLLLVGLAGGMGLGSVALAGAIAAVVLVVAGGLLAAAAFVAIAAGPALLITRQALLNRPAADGSSAEWYPIGMVLAQLTGYLGLLFLVLVVAWSGQPGGLYGAVEEAVASIIEAASADLAEMGPELPGALAAGAPALAMLLPGITLGWWLIVIAINIAVGQWLLVRYGRNARPSPSFVGLELPDWVIVPLIVAGLAWAFGSGNLAFVGASVTILFSMAFFLQGLAVVHALVRRTAASGILLAVFYFLLVLMGQMAILVIGLGLIEQWAHIRRRIGAA